VARLIPVAKSVPSDFWDAKKKSLDVGQKGVNPTPPNGIKAMYLKGLTTSLRVLKPHVSIVV